MHNRRRRLARKNTRSASFGCIKRIIGSSSLKPHNVALIPISFEECCQQNFRVAALPVPMLRGSWTCLQGQHGQQGRALHPRCLPATVGAWTSLTRQHFAIQRGMSSHPALNALAARRELGNGNPDLAHLTAFSTLQ
ncbi:uncharacterized protein LOC126409222 isoform X1 [Nymphaea colorata]|nr:uncharacterized protein LOC126409222 isoform X1 [Nymphaea colorata]